MVKSPHVVFGGSDAGAHYDMMANEALPIRTLITRVRDEGSLTLEEAVRGFTAVAAESIGLIDRGRLAPGMAADVVALDLDGLGEGEPRLVNDLPASSPRLTRQSHGLHYSVVNGRLLIEDGNLSGDLPGHLLRAGA
jgi:N-acyl-D-aspartate/D-glutamate deacylase